MPPAAPGPLSGVQAAQAQPPQVFDDPRHLVASIVEAAQEGEHNGILELLAPAGAAADDRHIAGRRIGGTVPGDDSQAAGEGDRTGGMRDRDRLDRRQDARSH
jgi:hypothetical protein